MSQKREPEVVSYSVRVCRRCDSPMARASASVRHVWHCRQCGRTSA